MNPSPTPDAEKLLAILNDYGHDLSTISMRSGKLPAWAAVSRLLALLEQTRKQTASDILNLANEYANHDETMRGSEEIRNYHYFNAINKIGGFDGR